MVTFVDSVVLGKARKSVGSESSYLGIPEEPDNYKDAIDYRGTGFWGWSSQSKPDMIPGVRRALPYSVLLSSFYPFVLEGW